MVLHGIFYHILWDRIFLNFNGPFLRMSMFLWVIYLIEPIVSLSKFDFFSMKIIYLGLLLIYFELLCPFNYPILKFDVSKFNVKSEPDPFFDPEGPDPTNLLTWAVSSSDPFQDQAWPCFQNMMPCICPQIEIRSTFLRHSWGMREIQPCRAENNFPASCVN